ncbi:DUF4123 domain-containing protein [Luteimonas sp. RD2P54]|uniref:DUF4123 domain-containing protein n=1 Tax=Luteimonas endophytica TaxID=3042023 RepID=A0ABT6J671_9GAMM|nr:DUF4123 domain-containing protein [Luteimonas endophytica]MDH5822331.1 DUF4123 domain-containing protein [Luteimonas endophytica]
MGGLWHRQLLAQDYALINPLQVDSELWSDLPVVPLVPKGFETQAHLMPRLLELKAMPEDARLQLLDRVSDQQRHSRFPYFSALFVATPPLEKVVMRLSSRLAIRGPDQSKALLRYYDPRVFHHLRWLLQEDQLGFLLLGIDSWSWRDVGGQWQQYRCSGTPTRSELRLTAEQWDDLQRLGLLNRCLQQIASSDPARASTAVIAQAANALLKAAFERHALSDSADRCLYAEQGIRFHSKIHHHPAMVERLDRAREGIISYVGACRDLDDAALQRFAEDLHQPQGLSP